MDAVIQRLLKKHPEERFGSAREVRVALAEIAHRFDPSLNLYMSQNGESSPSFSNTGASGSSSGSMNGQKYTTKNGMASISNPYVNPDEIGLLQPRASVPEAARIQANTETLTGQSSKMKFVVIAVAFGVFALIMASVLFYLSLTNKASVAEPVAVQVPVAAPVEEPAPQEAPEPAKPVPAAPVPDKRVIDINDTEVISELDSNGYVLSDAQLREFAKTECSVSEGDPIYQDAEMKAAVDLCAQGNFEEAYKVFDQSKNKFKDSKRFFIMSLINSYAVRRYRDAIRDALQLIIIDPAAVCTPAVREIIYSLYEDDVTYIRLRTGILNLFDQPGATEGLSWLLLLTPCNQHQTRFERLSDSIKVATKSFEEKYDETWLGMAVHLWDDFDAKSQCSIGKSVDRIVYRELKAECEGDEGSVPDSARCTMCFPIWKDKLSKK